MRDTPPAANRLGWRLAFGAAWLIAAAWLFGAIAEDVVTSDRLTTVDADLALWLHGHARPGLTAAMLAISQLHSTVAITLYATVLGIGCLVRRRWREFVAVVVCIGGGMVVNVLMKLAFHRARPVFDHPLLTLSSYSFPSGHVAASTLLYGLGVTWVFAATPARRWRVLAVVVAFVAIVLVATSRMVLGVHYLSDVAAAFAEGVAWLAICLTALSAFWREPTAVPVAVPAAGPERGVD
ncbi:MAG: phosphatase PAP2 family protein [Caldimonas sp.]